MAGLCPPGAGVGHGHVGGGGCGRRFVVCAEGYRAGVRLRGESYLLLVGSSGDLCVFYYSGVARLCFVVRSCGLLLSRSLPGGGASSPVSGFGSILTIGAGGVWTALQTVSLDSKSGNSVG